MMRLTRANRVLSLSVVAATVALTAACGSSGSSSSKTSATAAPARKGSVNTLNWWANWGDVWPDSLDPAVGTNTLALYAMALVDANLVKFDYPSMTIIPDLASNWTSSSNHLVWTFHLKPNAKFNNGDPVTANDVVWSITRALLPSTKSPVAMTYLNHIVGAAAVNAGKATTLSGVKALNPTTVQITLDKPIAYFLGALSYNTADVLDKKVMQGKPAGPYMTNTCASNVGAGPFKFVCLNKSSSKASFYPNGHSPFMKFAPNPYYYGPKPKINLYAPFFSTLDAEFRAYQAGELDGTIVPSGDLPIAQKMAGFVKRAAPITDYDTPNQQIPPFNNINCRLAVSYAIDRVGITTKLLRGTEGPLYGEVPPGILGYVSQPTGVPSYNPAKAKQYLAKCPGGLKNVTWTYQNVNTDIVHEMDAIRANIQAIGAPAPTMKPLTFNAWLKVVTQNMNNTKNQEQITENLWLDDYPDPQDWVTNLLHSGANYNIGGFNNPQYDKLADAGDLEANVQKRAQDYIQAQKIAVNDGAWIAVGYQYILAVINPKVHNIIDVNGFTWPLHNDWSKVSISS